MKAWAVIRNEQPLQCIEIADPVAAGTEVVLDVTRCGVCHSDLHFWHGSYNMGGGKLMSLADRGVTLPRAPGHEITGRVVAIGPEAEGVAVGDLRSCILGSDAGGVPGAKPARTIFAWRSAASACWRMAASARR